MLGSEKRNMNLRTFYLHRKFCQWKRTCFHVFTLWKSEWMRRVKGVAAKKQDQVGTKTWLVFDGLRDFIQDSNLFRIWLLVSDRLKLLENAGKCVTDSNDCKMLQNKVAFLKNVVKNVNFSFLCSICIHWKSLKALSNWKFIAKNLAGRLAIFFAGYQNINLSRVFFKSSSKDLSKLIRLKMNIL